MGTFAEELKTAMADSMDTLEAKIEMAKKTVKLYEDVKRLRNRGGEFSSKQIKAKARRKPTPKPTAQQQPQPKPQP